MSEEADFEQLEKELSEDINVVDEQELNETIVDGVEEVKPGQLAGYKYLKNPDIGESIILEISKIEKKPGRTMKNGQDGSTFETGLLNKKTNKRTEFNIITKNNECFNITSWGLYFGIFGKDSVIEQKAVELETYAGIKVKITHNYNGKDSKTKLSDLMKLRDLATIEEAEKHQKIVAAAIKNGTIYSVELVE